MYNAEKSGATFNVRDEVLKKCWDYLNINFAKFSQGNQIKIALELTKKQMPTQIQAEVKVTRMNDIKVETPIPGAAPKNRILEYDLG